MVYLLLWPKVEYIKSLIIRMDIQASATCGAFHRLWPFAHYIYSNSSYVALTFYQHEQHDMQNNKTQLESACVLSWKEIVMRAKSL